MVNVLCEISVVLFALIFLWSSTAFPILENPVRGYLGPCELVCHSTNKTELRESCQRGCRLYSIIEFVGQEEGVNGTLQTCNDNCKEAYPVGLEERSACQLGCQSQKPFTDRMGQVPDMEPDFASLDTSHVFYPLMYMHNMYSNFLDRVTSQMCMSWSFFGQDGTGRMIVIRSPPQVLNMNLQDMDYSAFRGTSSFLETNIESADNMATEVLKHSQLKSARGFVHEIDAAEADPWGYRMDDASSSDWLTCLSRKTHIPRLVLCIIIVLSSVAMIWLCLSAAISTPKDKLPQKLSICGDLEYLRYLPEKKAIHGIHPQEFVQARPLPIKVPMQDI